MNRTAINTRVQTLLQADDCSTHAKVKHNKCTLLNNNATNNPSPHIQLSAHNNTL